MKKFLITISKLPLPAMFVVGPARRIIWIFGVGAFLFVFPGRYDIERSNNAVTVGVNRSRAEIRKKMEDGSYPPGSPLHQEWAYEVLPEYSKPEICLRAAWPSYQWFLFWSYSLLLLHSIVEYLVSLLRRLKKTFPNIRIPWLNASAPEEKPNQAPEPTATAVTPPAAQDPRQP
jgi:hypothetical protein